MKIIEAMKRIKMNKSKIGDLQKKIGQFCANMSHESPLYGTGTKKKVDEWLQSCADIAQENVKLLTGIQKTNLATEVTMNLGDKEVTKTIAEWVWRRREYAPIDRVTWQKLSDRGLREGVMETSTGEKVQVSIVRHYDAEARDKKVAMYSEEPHVIDSTLEVINAVTDLVD